MGNGYGARLSKIGNAWLRSAPAYPFVLLRLGIAAVLLVRAWVERPMLLELYGNRGLIPWALSEIRPVGWLPSMSQLSRILGPYGITEDGSVYVVFFLYVLGL